MEITNAYLTVDQKNLSGDGSPKFIQALLSVQYIILNSFANEIDVVSLWLFKNFERDSL